MPGTMSGDCSSAMAKPSGCRNKATLATEESAEYPSSPSSQLHESCARSRSGTHRVTWCSTGWRVVTPLRLSVDVGCCDAPGAEREGAVEGVEGASAEVDQPAGVAVDGDDGVVVRRVEDAHLEGAAPADDRRHLGA